MTKNFDVKFTNIKLVEKDFEKYSNEVNKAIIKTQKQMVDTLEPMIKSNIPVDTGKLQSSINHTWKIKDDQSTVSITTDVKYGQFVEFGTGIKGESSPHPKAQQFDWIYNLNKQTKGQFPKRFMYKGYLWASRSQNNILRKYLRKVKI